MTRTRLQILDGELLWVYSPNNTYLGTVKVNSSGELEINSAAAFRFQVASAEKLTILSGGNVGIGTTNPGALLTIGTSNPILLLDNGSITGSMSLSGNGTIVQSVTADKALFLGTSGTGHIEFDAGGTEKMRVTSTGNVGIGTTNPTVGVLHVVGGIYSTTGIGAGATDITSGVVNVGTGFRIANAATTGTILRGNGTNYIASTATYPTTTTANQILFSSATNTISEITTANSSVLVTNGSGVPSLATDIPTAVTIGAAYVYRVGGTDVSIADGGTGQSTAALAFNALSPMSALGDTIYGAASGVGTRLAGNITTTKKFLTQTGDGVNSVAPSWGTVTSSDVGITPAALTKTDDTNITLTLGGSPTVALLAATSLTLGWTGTLAAARLNANVVQSITNDTNVTGSIAAQVLTLGWTGDLAFSRITQIATGTLLGRNTALTGDIEVITDIPTAITIGGAYIYRTGGTDVPVTDGGTGVSTLADGGLVVGNATNAVEVIAAGLTTQILVGGGALTNPAWGTDLPTAVTIGSAYIYRVAGTDVAVTDGGTGLSIGTSGGILGFTGTTTLASSVLLTANALILGGGAGATPTPLGSLGTTTTVLHGNAAGAPTFGAVSLTADVSGDLPFANIVQIATGTLLGRNTALTGDIEVITDIPTAITIGSAYIYRAGGTDIPLLDGGTNASLTASNGGIVYSTASALAILSGTATANQILMSGASTTPAWSTATYPATTTVSQILYSSATNTIAGLATGNSSILVTSGTGVPSLATDIPTAVTIGSAYVYRVAGTDVLVTDGGTGVSTLADGGLVVGNGTSAVEVVAAGLTTQILVGGGASTNPAWGTDLPTAVTIGGAYIYRVGGTDISVADGGTGLSSWTANGVLYASGTGTLANNADFTQNGTLLNYYGGTDGKGAYFGRAAVGSWSAYGVGSADFAFFGHTAMLATIGSYALIQENAGATYINSVSGQAINFRCNNAGTWSILSTGVLQAAAAQSITTAAGDLTLQPAAGSNLNITPSGAAWVLIDVGTQNGIDSQLQITNQGDNGAGIRLTANSTGGRQYRLISTASGNGPGAGTLSVYDATAGEYRFTIGSTGNVGIGTTNPGYSLEVYKASGTPLVKVTTTGAGEYYAGSYFSTDDSDVTLVSYDDGYTGVAAYTGKSILQAGGGNLGLAAWNPSSNIEFYAGGRTSSELRMFISSSGNVGIGTTGPVQKLSLGGTDDSIGWANTAEVAGWNNAASNVSLLFKTTSGGAGAQTTKMIILGSGNVGIGTINPGNNLEVVNTVHNKGLTLSGSGDVSPGLRLISGGTGAGNRNWGIVINNDVSGDFGIRYSNAKNGDPFSAGTSALNISSTGNVGIGTTNPHNNFQMQVTGNTTWEGGIAAGGNGANVVLGELVGVAQIGGHNSALTAWADLAINSGGGNVGIGTTNPSSFLLQLAGNCGPNANRSYNLGSTALRWNNIWMNPGTVQQIDNGKKYEAGLWFSGETGQYAVSTLTSTNDIGTGKFSTWVRIIPPTANPSVVGGICAVGTGSASVAGTSFALSIDTSGQLVATLYGATTSDFRKATISSFVANFGGQVVDIVTTRSGATFKIYINGVDTSFSESTGGTPPAWSATVGSDYAWIGRLDSSTHFAGTYYKFVILNLALTQSEVDEFLCNDVPTRMKYGYILGVTSGTLYQGIRYVINTYVAGDDFTNVGGTNVTGTEFISTGITPTTWTNSSSLSQQGAFLNWDFSSTSNFALNYGAITTIADVAFGPDATITSAGYAGVRSSKYNRQIVVNTARTNDLHAQTSLNLAFTPATGTNNVFLTLEGGVVKQQVGASGSGVTSVAMTVPVQLSVAGSPITSSGTLAVSWADQNPNIVLAGPSSGAAAAPTFRSLVWADLPVQTLSSQYTEVGNVGSGEDDLMTYTVAAGKLTNNGDRLRIVMSGSCAANTNAKTIKYYVNGVALLTDIALELTDPTWRMEIDVIRIDASTGRYSYINHGSAVTASSGSVSVTWSGTCVIKCTGTATSNNDVVQNSMYVEYYAAP